MADSIDSLIDAQISTEERKLLMSLRKQNLSPEEMKIIIQGFKQKHNREIKKYDHSRKNYKFKFALLGDTHFGNNDTAKEALHDFYKLAHKRGINEFYHAGDLVDGLHVHRGSEYEQYALGMNNQVDDVIQDYPHLKDVKTYYILGNHDQWFGKNVGGSIDRMITPKRSDLVCLGFDEADIKIAKNSVLRLVHPGGGSSYALSYKPQKLIESITGGNKPNILGIGHFHKSLYMFYRNVHSYLTGCFENQTPFMRSKSLAAMVGGWIIEGKAGKQGGIKEITSTFIPYLKG